MKSILSKWNAQDLWQSIHNLLLGNHFLPLSAKTLLTDQTRLFLCLWCPIYSPSSPTLLLLFFLSEIGTPWILEQRKFMCWWRHQSDGSREALGGHAQTWICMKITLPASYLSLAQYTVQSYYWELKAKHFTLSGVCVLPRRCAMDREQVLTSPTPCITYRHLRSFNLGNENEREQNRGFTQPANQKKTISLTASRSPHSEPSRNEGWLLSYTSINFLLTLQQALLPKTELMVLFSALAGFVFHGSVCSAQPDPEFAKSTAVEAASIAFRASLGVLHLVATQ